MWKVLAVCLLTVLSFLSFAESCASAPSLSCTLTTSEIEVGDVLPGTEDRDVKKLLGVHAFYWSMQTDLYGNTPSKVSPQAVSILKNSGVGFIRYGGGVNEIDWRTCMGWIMERPKQQIVNWTGPIRCIFGLAEYESLNNELALTSSWHIANVVGFEGRVNPIDGLVQDAGDRAKLIKELANERQRYWEIGNELDRDTLRWSAEKITERGLPVAQAIKRNDASAHIIIPLLEYSPDWIKNAETHNRTLIRQHKAVANDYALHLYYENAPWGPSVANRLASVRNVARIINSENISSPGIWVTEHARPPPGTPADKDWNKTWYQTGNHDAVIATADFLIGLSQIPMVKGAAWHGVRTGPWNFIDVPSPGVMRETPMSRLFEMIKPYADYQTLTTKTNSVADISLSGGYAIRATAFADKSVSSSKTILWLVNRSFAEKTVKLTKKSFALARKLTIDKTVIAEHYNPSVPVAKLPVESDVVYPTNSSISIALPKRSVVLLSVNAGEKL